MKLNKREVSAIANQVIKRLVDVNKEHNKKVKESKEYINFEESFKKTTEGKDLLKFIELRNKYTDTYGFSSYRNWDNIMTMARSKAFKNKLVSEVRISDVEDAIVIANMEGKTGEEMIDLIFKQFS